MADHNNPTTMLNTLSMVVSDLSSVSDQDLTIDQRIALGHAYAQIVLATMAVKKQYPKA